MFIIVRKKINIKEWYESMTYTKSKSIFLKLAALVFIALFCIMVFSSPVRAEETSAAELTPDITLSNQGSVSRMTDGSYNTKTSFSAGDTIHVTSSEKMYSGCLRRNKGGIKRGSDQYRSYIWNNPGSRNYQTEPSRSSG